MPLYILDYSAWKRLFEMPRPYWTLGKYMKDINEVLQFIDTYRYVEISKESVPDESKLVKLYRKHWYPRN